MIISRTPVRVSFCGGGTDLDWFANSEQNGGRVTSLALNRHIHVTVNARFDDKVRVSYSKMELVHNFEDIEHELVREAMRITGVTSGVEITTIADIPSRGTGLGSSSTVTVGLLNALHNFAGRQVSAEQLAEEACNIEIDIPLLKTEYKNKNDLIFFILLFTYLVIFLIFKVNNNVK